MKQRSIMTKSGLTKRRKVIIYIIMTILILGIVSGFTDPFITDNTKYSAQLDEIIVMEAEPPADGSPEDYDLLSNLKFAAYKLHHASFFRGETNGKTVADIGFTTYTQNVHNLRIATGKNVVFAETISSSSLVSVAEQKYADNGIIIFRPSTSVKGSSAKYANSAYQMSYEEYSKNYGSVPNQLSKYIVNEKTIKGVKDENAKVKSANNANGADEENDGNEEGGFDFYVPENLVAGADGNYKFTLTLDETASSLYYRNEVRTLAGADQNPKFYSVSLTITIDKNWNPISVYTVENYDIAIPVLGAMNCTGKLTEVFSQIDDENGVIPEQSFFQPYVDDAKNGLGGGDIDIPSKPSSPADYLASAFADYISGEKNLDLTVDVTSGDISAYDLILSLNIDSMDVQAMLGDLYVKYSGDKVNVRLNDINGYMSVDEFTELTKNEQIAKLMGSFDGFDITSLFGGDILGTVFSDCEMTSEDGVTRIHMPFTIDASGLNLGVDSVTVDASIYIKDDGLVLKSITGDITVAGRTISVVAKPLRAAPIFPSIDGAIDLSGIIDFVPDLLNTAAQKAIGVSGSVTVDGQAYDITAYIDLADGIKADMVISAMGLDVSVKYTGDMIYIGIGNIDVRGTKDELPLLLDALGEYVDFDYYLDILERLMPASVNDVISMIRSLDITESDITLGLNFLTTPINISLERADGLIGGFDLDLKFNLLGVKLDAAADFDITYPDAREISLPDGEDYITFTELAELITAISPYVNAKYGYDVTFNGTVLTLKDEYSIGGVLAIDKFTDSKGNVTGVDASGSINVLGNTLDVIYANDTAYIEIANVKAKLSRGNIDRLRSPAMRIVDMLVDLGSIDTSDTLKTALGAVKSITYKDGVPNIVLTTGSGEVTVKFDPATGKATANGSAFDCKLNAELDIGIAKSAHSIEEPQELDSYIDLAELDITLDAIADIIENKSLSATVKASVAETAYEMDLTMSFENGLALKLTESTLPLDLTVIDGKAYISLCDNINAVGTLDDIPSLLDALSPVIPEDVRKTIDSILNITPSDIDIADALSGALAAVKGVAVKNDLLRADIAYNGIIAEVYAALALDGFWANVNIDGTEIDVTLRNISADPVTVNVPNGEYAKASDIIAAAAPIVPLAENSALTLTVDTEIYGVTVGGDVYFSIERGEVDADLMAGDVPIKVVVKDGRLYAAIGNDVKLTGELNEQSIMQLVDGLDVIFDGLKATVQKLVNAIKSLTAQKLLKSVALSPTADGFTVTIDLSETDLGMTVALTAHTQNDALSAIDVDCAILDISASMSFDAVTVDKTLSALNSASACIGEIPLSLDIGINGVASRTVEIIQDCAPIDDIIELIEPLASLTNEAMSASSITLDLSALAVTSANKQMNISGTATVNFDPIAIDVSLTLFENTADKQALDIKYVDGKLYVKSGNIMLSFDADTDKGRLYAIVESYVKKGYLPQYLGDEIGKLLGLKKGTSIFSEITLLIDRMQEIAAAKNDVQTIVELLFSPLGNLSKDSAIKTLINKVRLFERDGNIVVAINMLGMTFNITPYVANGVLQSATVDTIVSVLDDLYVGITVTGYALDENGVAINAPANADKYVSVAEFAEMLDNAVNTFTTFDADGNITFELNTFDFVYDIYKIETYEDKDGNILPVKDSAGRDKPLEENGQKVIDKSITVSNKPNGVSALKGKFIKVESKDEDGKTKVSYKFNLEAHVKLDISSLTHSTPLLIDLYVINNDNYPDGIAFLDYMENNGNGERISIDYDSIMQIVAAVMDILAVNDTTVETLLGDYRLNVDKTIFESMDISGLPKIRAKLNNIAYAINTADMAIEDVKAGWKLVMTAGNTDVLSERINEIKPYFISGFDRIKAAFNALKSETDITETKPNDNTSKDSATETEPDDATNGDGEEDVEAAPTYINGKLYKDIVNGVTIAKSSKTVDNVITDFLTATILNSVTVNTPGTATVEVTQSNSTIDSITVTDLDVNTAKLNKFYALFTAGKTFTEDEEIKLPSNYNSSTSNATYSDFANIKHLLFDIMNTANMMEFEIGNINKADTNNSIVMKITTGIYNIDLNIKYNAKIGILYQGENKNPKYKTAAVIELNHDKVMGKAIGFIPAGVIMPQCVTRLYFYDNYIYIRGVKSWNESLGSVKNMQYVETCYSVEDLSNMLNAADGIEKFMNQFVYYLLPLSSTIQSVINEAIKMEMSDENRTIAQVFKGYSYNIDQSTKVATHKLVLGLKELAGISVLNDVTLSINGKNDDDDNILDNYVEKLHVDTKVLGSMVKLDIYATLGNVASDTESGVAKIKSGGLSNTIEGESINDIINTRIPNTSWDRIWA